MLDQAATAESTRAQLCDQKRLSVEVFGALINLSGRRRFTSQRVVLYAVLASMGHEGAVATARHTLDQFRDAHTTLTEGRGAMPGIFCDQLHDAYFGPMQAERVIRDFIALADAALAAIVDNARGAPALLDELVRSAPPLLSVLNAVTLVYEEQSMRHAQARKRQLTDMLGEIKTVARRARKVALHAQIVAARSGQQAREFSAAAGSMTGVTAEIDDLALAALGSALAY